MTLMDWGTMFMSDVLFQDRLTHMIVRYYPLHQGRPEGRGGKSGTGLDTNLGELLNGCLSCYGGAQALDHVWPFVLCAFLDISFWVQVSQTRRWSHKLLIEVLGLYFRTSLACFSGPSASILSLDRM